MCIENRPVLCNSVAWSRSQGLLPNGNRKLSRQGMPLNHYSGVSSFAQYAVTMPQTLIKVDPTVPLDIVAMFGCAVVTGAGSVFNAARVRPGQSVVVFGLGGVGLNAVMAAKLSSADRIIGVDIHESKFALARELGCTDCVLATDPDIVPRIKELTQGGVDYAFEVSGSKPAMATAIAVTRKGGEIIGVGLGASGDLYAYDHAQLVTEEKVIRGSFLGSGVPARDLPLYVDYFRDGRLPVDRLKSGTMGFEQLNKNLDMLDKGDVVRQILLPHGP